MKLDYDEISPITGEKTVVVEPLEIGGDTFVKMCLESGYHTQTNWTEDSPELETYMENITQHNIDHKIVAEDGSIWFPYTLTTQKATIFADIFEKEFSWFVMPIVKEDGDKEGEYKLSLGENQVKHFPKDDFAGALSHFFMLEMR